MGKLRPCVICLLVAAVACSLLPSRASAQDSDLAAAVKATYLYKFAAFIRWPSNAAEFPGDVFPLCVVGDDNAFAGVLERAVHGQTVEGHPIVARSVPPAVPPSGCAVIYAAGAGAVAQQTIIGAVHDKPVLTVTDDTDAGAAKGIINFVIRDNRVRFEIDESAAAAAGLSISSKLLALAVALHSDSR